MSTCKGPEAAPSRAGVAAAPVATAAEPRAVAGGVCGLLGSGSRMSAPSPRPNAFLGIGNDLLGELRIAFCALTMNIVKNDRFTKTWCFRKAYIARNHTLKDLCSKETAQIRGYLPGKGRPLIVHRKQDAFDFEAWIQ